MGKEIKEKIIEIIKGIGMPKKIISQTEFYNWQADQILELFEKEKQKWVEEILLPEEFVDKGREDDNFIQGEVVGWNAYKEELKQIIKK